MKKSEIELPEFFDRYINLVPQEDLFLAFEASLLQIQTIDLRKLEKLKDKPYAEGKWTVNNVIQHIVDFERVFSYRALIFARGIKSSEGLDENFFAENSHADQKDVKNIVNDLMLARNATISQFKNFSKEELMQKGNSWKYEISVAALGFNMIGHQIHHFNVLEERYFPTLDI